MKIFELHFNPKPRNDRFFESFVYEPKNSYEKKLGSLFIIGELTNSSSYNSNFLSNLSGAIKKKYYSLSFKNPSKAITEGLKKANEFLEEEVKKENVNWLGNLNFSVFSLKDSDLSFTITGKVKALLIRGNKINDIGGNIDSTEIEPYPLKVFFNVVSGKLCEGDILLVITEELFNFLSEEKIIDKIAEKSDLDEDSLKDIFPQNIFKEGKGKDVSGLCFIACLKEEKKTKEMIFEKQKESIITSLLKRVKKPKISAPKIKFKDTRVILIIIFIAILAIGAAFFKSDEQAKRSETEKTLIKIEEKLEKGKEFIKYGNHKEAEIVLEEAWNEVSLLAKDKKSPFYTKAEPLKESIEENLYIVNKIEINNDPEVFIDMGPDNVGFVAQSISFSNSKFYFSSQVTKDVYIYNRNKGEKMKSAYEIDLSDDSSDFILFFSKSDNISYIHDNELKEAKINVNASSNFRSFSSYNLSLYFLDETNNEILKYPYQNNFKWNDPESVLKPEKKAKSITVDGYIWVLNEKNEIESYYRGEQKKTISLDIFPIVRNLTRIKTKIELPYIYISEPINNRIIVIDKNGNLIKQFKSEKFDNIKDFSISYNGNTIWVLNGSNVYELKL